MNTTPGRCAVPAHARLRVSPPGGGTLIAGWPEPRGRCRGVRAITGTLVAAGDGSPVQRLETADVIVTAGEGRSAGPGGWLRCYPGCAVTVSPAGPGQCRIATGDGIVLPVAVSGPSAVGALACAIFVHGWLAAGWPLDLLRPARLHVSHDEGEGPEPGLPLFFKLSYCPASDGGLEASA